MIFLEIGAWIGIAMAFVMVASVMVAVYVSNARATRERQELATRRGWDLQLKPAPKTPWRLAEHGSWLLDTKESGSGEDATTDYKWSAPTRRDGSAQIQIQHRQIAEWMSGGAGRKRAMAIAAGISRFAGASASFEQSIKALEPLEVAEFSRPDLADYRLITNQISSRLALEIVGDDAQIGFLKWRATLPRHRGVSADLKRELERGALRVQTSESLENAASLEAFLDFCAALKR